VQKPGDLNSNNQKCLRITGVPGNDYNSRRWILECGRCLNIYGCNSTDAWERKCPKCQNGKPGLPVPTERDGEDWNREEHVIAFHVYSRIEFGTIHMRNPAVIELAALLGRKVGSASRKLANFARLDPFHQDRDVTGLPHGAKGEEAVWEEFSEHPENLAFESALLLAARLGCPVTQLADVDESELPPSGIEREVMVKIRVNQGFFRNRVLSAYESRCCVTGLGTPSLLVASHIVPWAEEARHRLNPRNGLCLNALHDRAFDRRLMWIDSNFVLHLSPSLHNSSDASNEAIRWLMSFDGQPLKLPKRFTPDLELLMRHAEACKRREVAAFGAPLSL
jgi:putative restriction endonuclease